jgi:hypothetical protein
MPALLEAQNASDAVWVKLVHRELAWGGAVQQLADIQTSMTAKGLEVGKEMQAGLEQQHQAEIGQRQAVAAAFGSALQNAGESMQRQQLINSLNRPRTTNCNAFGSSATCTTY